MDVFNAESECDKALGNRNTTNHIISISIATLRSFSMFSA
jgi:hypothetical protein